jgi:hypothetical protein
VTLKVINLGLPKSGTTSFARAMKRAGLNAADYRIRKGQTPDATLHGAFVGDLIYRGYFETGDPGAYLADFEAISEMSTLRGGHCLWPQTDFGVIEAFRKHHPGVRFVATRRTTAALSRSMENWSDLTSERLPKGSLPGLPAGYGATGGQRERWIRAHYAFLRRIFAGRDDYMEVPVAAPDIREKLEAFLGFDLPWWGRSNVRSGPGRGK